jgi:hypothetical protein
MITLVQRSPPLPRILDACLPIWLTIAACGGSTSRSEVGPTDGGDATGEDGSGGSSGGAVSGSSTSSGGGSTGGAPSTCIVGSQGCLCDTTGACAPGLTCTPQSAPEPSLCCTGSNCAHSGGGVGATCGPVATSAACTPGITVPSATGGNDTCGYASTTFVESTTLCAINAVGGGSQPAVIQVFYNDEHALTLGCATSTNSVSPLTTDPGSATYPQTGDPACVDAVGRPMRPVLYITDTTADATCTAGDLQKGGQPYEPVAVFGTWKSATEGAGNVGTPATMDPTANKWNLGSSADPPPAAATTMGMPPMGVMPMGMPMAMSCGEGYSAELRFEVGLVAGHSYRFQAIVHDGDQNKGGDSGEGCAVFCAGSGNSCPEGAQTCTGTESGTQCPEGSVCKQRCCVPSTGTPSSTLPDGSLPIP